MLLDVKIKSYLLEGDVFNDSEVEEFLSEQGP